MKKIWEVYKRDLKKICHNLFAAIITIGIIIIPALYAWFNILQLGSVFQYQWN